MCAAAAGKKQFLKMAGCTSRRNRPEEVTYINSDYALRPARHCKPCGAHCVCRDSAVFRLEPATCRATHEWPLYVINVKIRLCLLHREITACNP